MHNNLKLDWLNFTLKYDVKELEEKEIAPIDYFLSVFPEFMEIIDTSVIGKLRTHYQHVLLFNEDIVVLYDDIDANNQKGVNVQVPSHSLNYFHDLMGCKTVLDILKMLKDRNCQVSRIDLCYDDYKKMLRPVQFNRWFSDKKFKSNMSMWKFCGGRSGGDTFYIGTRRTKILRIYDKDLESDGAIDAVRYEFELHNDRARKLVAYYLENGGIDFCSLLLSYFDIVERGSVKNISECPRIEEFNDFIEEIKLSRIVKIEYPKLDNIDRCKSIKDYVENNLVQVIKKYMYLYGKDALINCVTKTPPNIMTEYFIKNYGEEFRKKIRLNY